MWEKRYKKHPDIVSRKIVDEVILVPIKRRLADVDSIYLLQEDVSIRIWDLIDGERSIREIRDIICTEFQVSPMQAEKDLTAFLKQLEEVGGITEERDASSEVCP